MSRPSLTEQMDQFAKDHAEKQQFQATKSEPMSDRELLIKLKQQPGRPDRETLIKMIMKDKGCTRAQAKEEIKHFDREMVRQYRLREKKVEENENYSTRKIKPMLLNVLGTLGD